jgi:uncharacterized protein
MDDFKTYYTRKYGEIKQIVSISDLIKQINKIMHADNANDSMYLTREQLGRILKNSLKRSEQIDMTGKDLVTAILTELNFEGSLYDEIPQDLDKYNAQTKDDLTKLISQYLLLYSGNISSMVNDMDNPTIARIIIQMNEPHPAFYQKIKEDVRNYTDKYIKPLGYDVYVSGNVDLGVEINKLTFSSQILSIIIAIFFILVIISIMFRSVIVGFLGSIPIVGALIINFGLMGFFNISLDFATAMIASITIGIGIDYSIHFLSRYFYERETGCDDERCTITTLQTSGKAIMINTFSVAAGFGVLSFASLQPLVFFGILTGITMVTSSIGAISVLPILLNHYHGKKSVDTTHIRDQNSQKVHFSIV